MRAWRKEIRARIEEAQTYLSTERLMKLKTVALFSQHRDALPIFAQLNFDSPVLKNDDVRHAQCTAFRGHVSQVPRGEMPGGHRARRCGLPKPFSCVVAHNRSCPGSSIFISLTFERPHFCNFLLLPAGLAFFESEFILSSAAGLEEKTMEEPAQASAAKQYRVVVATENGVLKGACAYFLTASGSVYLLQTLSDTALGRSRPSKGGAAISVGKPTEDARD